MTPSDCRGCGPNGHWRARRPAPTPAIGRRRPRPAPSRRRRRHCGTHSGQDALGAGAAAAVPQGSTRSRGRTAGQHTEPRPSQLRNSHDLYRPPSDLGASCTLRHRVRYTVLVRGQARPRRGGASRNEGQGRPRPRPRREGPVRGAAQEAHCPQEGERREKARRRRRRRPSLKKDRAPQEDGRRQAGQGHSGRRQVHEDRHHRHDHQSQGRPPQGQRGLPRVRRLPDAQDEEDAAARDRLQGRDFARDPAQAADRVQQAPGGGEAPRQKVRREGQVPGADHRR